MSSVLTPEPEQICQHVILKLCKISGQQQKILFCLFLKNELRGVLGSSQNQWERDTNMALSCPLLTAPVTALWLSSCSVVCCCFDSKVWKYPLTADILDVAKIFLRRLGQLRKWWLLFFFFSSHFYLSKTCAEFHRTKNRSTLRDSSWQLFLFHFLFLFFSLVALIGGIQLSGSFYITTLRDHWNQSGKAAI